MELIDWLILGGTLLFIVLYGSWKTRRQNDITGYLKGDNEMDWATIGLSIMATQASAITFLSTPGQAYEDGMGFVQFYFGLPLAMILISAFFLPIYYRLKVFTAYEYLEKRFDIRMRLFTAALFLVSRGLAAGITIYAPAIILSSLLGWDLRITILIVGLLVTVYTVSGGTKAVSLTQKWQMAVILFGMVASFFFILNGLPEGVHLGESIDIAGMLGKMNVIDTSIDFENRYTLISGITGGLFLSLSYFGTDQSQVQRYLGGRSLKQSRLGLMFNGLLKVPMQFFILFIGVMVFVFYQFNTPPAFFNQPDLERAKEEGYSAQIEEYDALFRQAHAAKAVRLKQWVESEGEAAKGLEREILTLNAEQNQIRSDLKSMLKRADNNIETKDSDYIFLHFILERMPQGLIGLLLAVILSAAMSSTAGELNALASTTVVDFYKRLSPLDEGPKKDLIASKLFTALWGIMAISVALMANLFDNLIQLVNILGSLFYGTILGIFLVAFFLKKVKAKAIFPAALIAEMIVLVCHYLNTQDIIDIGYLWYNVIGCGVVLFLALFFQSISKFEEEVID